MATRVVSPGQSIDQVLAVANNGDLIQLQSGNYHGTSGLGESMALRGLNDIRMEGAGRGSTRVFGGPQITGSWTLHGGDVYYASIPFNITQRIDASSPRENVFTRGGHQVVVYIDGMWGHHAASANACDDPVTPNGVTFEGAEFSYFIDYSLDRLYVGGLGGSPSGRYVVVSNQDSCLGGFGDRLDVEGVSFHAYHPRTQYGAIGGGGGTGHGQDWHFNECEISIVHGAGVQAKNHGFWWTRGAIHRIGQLNIGMSPYFGSISGPARMNDCLLENSTIEWGNLKDYRPGHEGGLSKFAWTRNLQVLHCEWRKSYGFGIWTDINNAETTYRFNISEDNWGDALKHEISWSAIIQYNLLRNCGVWPTADIGGWPKSADGGSGWGSFPGVAIQESDGTYDGAGIDVSHNLIYGNRGGVFFRQIQRCCDGSNPNAGNPDAYHMGSVSVHHNDVAWDLGLHGGGNSHGGPFNGCGAQTNPGPTHGFSWNEMKSRSLSFQNNRYDFTYDGQTYTGPGSLYWDGDGRSESDWQNTYGFDTTQTGRNSPPEVFGIEPTTGVNTRGRVSWGELEVPGAGVADLRGRVSWAELQVPDFGAGTDTYSDAYTDSY